MTSARGDISTPLIKCDVTAVFAIELKFCLNILIIDSENYQTHLHMHFNSGKNRFEIFVKDLCQKLQLTFLQRQ